MAFELRKAETVEDIQSLIIIYLHDPVTGLARAQPGPLICLITQDQAEDETEQPKTERPTYSQAANIVIPHAAKHGTAKPEQNREADLNAVKGDNKGKGKGKGYGECWHCGQWGHPRRECPELLKENGIMAAFKGRGKGKGKGYKLPAPTTTTTTAISIAQTLNTMSRIMNNRLNTTTTDVHNKY